MEPQSDKGADPYSPQNSTKSAQNDGQTTHANMQANRHEAKAPKGHFTSNNKPKLWHD